MKTNINNCLFGISYTVQKSFGLYSLVIFVSILYAVVSRFVIWYIGGIINIIPEILAGEDVDMQEILNLLCIFVILSVISGLAYHLYYNISNSLLSSRMEIYLQRDIVEMTEKIPLHKFDLSDFCNQYDEATSAIGNLNGYVLQNIFILQSIFSLIVTGVLLYKSNIAILILFILSGIFSVFLSRKHASINFELWKRSNVRKRQNSYIEGLFFENNANREIRLFRLANYFRTAYRNNDKEILEDTISAESPMYKKLGAFVLFQECASILSIIVGLFFVRNGTMPVGNLFSIFALTLSSLGKIREFRDNVENWQLATMQVGCAKTFINTYGKRKNENNKNIISEINSGTSSSIQFNDVCFSYLPEKRVLHNINLTIKSGEIVALIGENGSGKSTLIKLLCGLYEPSSGKVIVEGVNPYTHRNNLSTCAVFQDFAHFPLTLRENIVLGALNEKNNDTKIHSVMNKVGIEYLEEKIGGLDKTISKMYAPDGVEISSGEWQKVAIARAYMVDRKIMIFDEPTASLDPLSEINQFQTICNDFRGKTILFTSHRIGLARMADRIVVMNDGCIVENGSHDELMKNKGKYHELYTAQAKWYQEGKTVC